MEKEGEQMERTQVWAERTQVWTRELERKGECFKKGKRESHIVTCGCRPHPKHDDLEDLYRNNYGLRN